MIHLVEDVPIRLNMELDLLYQDGSLVERRRTHNIVVNTGRQFMSEVITAQAFGGAPVRHDNRLVQYVGFGIGGTRQTNADALNPASALSIEYPGTNNQTDIDVTVAGLERPVKVSSSPVYLQEVAIPGDFPTAQSTRFRASFSQSEINFAHANVPLSEVGLYLSGADPTKPNGAGVYPGTSVNMVAYDTFLPVEKTGLFSILVRWEWRF